MMSHKSDHKLHKKGATHKNPIRSGQELHLHHNTLTMMMIIFTRPQMKVMVYMQVIAAEGEHKASRSLRLAAEVIADSPAALQVGLQG